jgi:hypothetical protein
MKYTIQVGSGAIKTGSGIQKLIGGIHRQHGDCVIFSPYTSDLYILNLWFDTFDCLHHMAV